MVSMPNAERQALFRNRRDARLLTLELKTKALTSENATLGAEIGRLNRYIAYLRGYIERNVPQQPQQPPEPDKQQQQAGQMTGPNRPAVAK
jgi:hypothetical protein